MSNNYFTTKHKIFDTAIELANQNFQELLPTDNYKLCNVIQINATAKQFWFTTQKLVEQSKNLIKVTNSNIIENIKFKDVQKWQLKN